VKIFYLAVNILLCFTIFSQMACVSSSRGLSARQLNKKIHRSAVFSTHFTGFALYDPAAQKTIYTYNADKYFTPASNTKIFTFYTSVKMLGDSIPALQYTIKNDSLIFWGTGDPSFLHPDLKSTAAYQFLCQRPETTLYYVNNYMGTHFGPGWAWGDYNDYYQPEKSAFPVYGNIVRFQVDSLHQIQSYPSFFTRYIEQDSTGSFQTDIIQRDLSDNIFTYYPDSTKPGFTKDVPYKYSPGTLLQLLSDTLHKTLTLIDKPIITGEVHTMYSITADSVYKRMMHESDNFLAEQLLLLCASTRWDTLQSEKTIAYAQQHLLQDLPHTPIWRDGSGLSRYNLFTPTSMVHLLKKIYLEVPQERLFAILPAGGQSGTLKNWYKSDKPQPYVYAKTGSLANVHCLSGYLVTKRGKTLIFSFMHNSIVRPINEVRREMEKVLKGLHERY
jgi:D-alanyl-D-alanine carboxypeptidase/D-alanyl-D-alanine-endopeptidase (penicillin-binding protein 4)